MSSAIYPETLSAASAKATPALESGWHSGSVRRRGTAKQGRALEVLGHAVEYLVDSRLLLIEERSSQDEHEAVQILMRLNRSVFADCPEVVPLRKRISRWIRRGE